MNQSQNYMKANRVLNIDDIPIQTAKAKNFEELLETNLKQMGTKEQSEEGSISYQNHNEEDQR